MISSPDYQVEDISKVPACDEIDYRTMGIVQLVNAARWNKAAQEELARRYGSSNRTFDFDYELRHPGHADQKVHNPNKGGSSSGFAGNPVPKGWKRPKPEVEGNHETDRANGMSDGEWVTVAYSHGLTPDLKMDTLKESEICSDSELEAIDAYGGGSSRFQSAALGTIQGEHAQEYIDLAQDLKNVLNRNSLEHDTTLHRGFGTGMLARIEEAGVGGRVRTDRFVSSSADSKVAYSFSGIEDRRRIMVIKAPAGTKGAYIDRVFRLNRGADNKVAKKYGIPGRGEAEFVMPPGAVFKIDSIIKRDGVTTVEVTVEP